jgi:hypothetical protein
LLLLNSCDDAVTYTLPQSPKNRGWKMIMDTSVLEQPFRHKKFDGKFDVYARSFVLLQELVEETAKQELSGKEAVARETAAATPEPEPELEPMEVLETSPFPSESELEPLQPPASIEPQVPEVPDAQPEFADPLPVD